MKAGRFLWIERKDCKVVITQDSQLGTCTPYYYFTFPCGDQEDAELLTRHFQSLWDDLFAGIRSEAYVLGWKDAKSKKPKKTEFSALAGITEKGFEIGW